MYHRRPTDHSLQNTGLEIKRLVTGGPCSLLCFMAGDAADWHSLSLTPLGCPLKGTGHLSRCSVLLASCCPCNTCALRWYPRIHAMLLFAPTSSRIKATAQGMQNNVGLFFILKKKDSMQPTPAPNHPWMGRLVSTAPRSPKVEQNLPWCSPLYSPPSPLPALQADTLAPPAAFGLC